MKITAIVPSLNPDEKFLTVVNELVAAGFSRIILVDDGSKKENQFYFDTAVRQHPQCVLLCHFRNLGKGRAIKTALNYFLNNRGEDVGVVTVDGDGQHCAEDVLACAAALEAAPDSLVLGCRSFSGDGIPARSSFGNKVTAWCFKTLCGIAVSDTQTGLRGISAQFAEEILDLAGERFEYETNMLLETKRSGVAIKEVPIRTVYLEQNATSHFRPLRDSLSIYTLIFKFLWSGIASTVCDLLLFLLLSTVLRFLPQKLYLLLATVGARLCSSILNYTLNKNFVFGSKAPVSGTVLKYYALCLVQMAASYGGVCLLTMVLHLPEVLAKIITDTLLFLVSFQIQREWIFAAKPIATEEK